MQEHRSTFYFPYWNIPGARFVVPRLRDFHANLSLIDKQLDDLIQRAINTQQVDDIEALQVRAGPRLACHPEPSNARSYNCQGPHEQPAMQRAAHGAEFRERA